MKKLISYLLAISLTGLSAGALATTTKAPAGVPTPVAPAGQVVNQNSGDAGRIGVLDMRKLMEKSSQIATIRENLRKEYQPRQQKILAAQNKLKDDAARLRRDNAIMNNNDRKQLEQKLITEQAELQKQQTTFQQDLMNSQNKALQVFLNTVRGIVEKIAQKEKLYLVITKDTVAYVSANLDITDKVAKDLPK